MNQLLSNTRWLDIELKKEKPKDTRKFKPSTKKPEKELSTDDVDNLENESKEEITELPERLTSFKKALEELEGLEKEKEAKLKKKKLKDKELVKILIDSREKNSKILFYLKKQGIDLDFKQLDCGDYILSDRVAVEYKKGEDLLSSIIDGRLFEQLGLLTNAYHIPILIIEGFPTGGIHPEAIAGALASFMIDFGVSIIQTQNSEETATILKRIAMREQKTKRRKILIRKAHKMGNPNENAIQVVSAYPGINRTLATRLLETFSTIKNVINSTQEELQKVDGLGEKKSQKILDISEREYQD